MFCSFRNQFWKNGTEINKFGINKSITPELDFSRKWNFHQNKASTRLQLHVNNQKNPRVQICETSKNVSLRTKLVLFSKFLDNQIFSRRAFFSNSYHYWPLILCKESKEFDMPKWRKVWKGKFGPIWVPDFRPRFSGWRSEDGQNLIKGI